ncbi:hypothetical protein [Nostoc sp. CMAA1605]|uniref:hypothetical protein n=1 Tax=Nostoc sp. CMAA1605 TaxID=2055159 RepID=UPI001F24D511|nr:hypothetical protein [Nostoc sp. CMAA1605]
MQGAGGRGQGKKNFTQHLALITQHSLLSTQHSALSTHYSLLSIYPLKITT